ncbi:MAG: MerR family transcriptional regulator [Clostridium sp.]
MYTISQFSKLCSLTVKALRYYDTEGLLKPSFRKAENQYRYYSDEDLKTARMIQYLRSLDFSIMEIKDILENNKGEDLSYILQEKINRIEANMRKERELIQLMREHSLAQSEEHVENAYVIDTVTVTKQLVASIRFTGRYCDLDTYLPLLYKAVKNNASGKHFNLYHDEECKEIADIELCIPVRKEIRHPSIACRYLPEMHALHTTHYGSYDMLWAAYKTLFAYANEHDLRILTPSREDYVKSPGMLFRGNPSTYMTELYLPFERTGSTRL